MRGRFALVVILVVAGLFGSAAIPPETIYPTNSPDPVGTVVHEWGTFTSVAAADGGPLEWLPLSSRGDLPCFVDKLPFHGKGLIPGTIRMETPVLYFYAQKEAAYDVRVRFPQGVLTEWYPRADVTPEKVGNGTLLAPGFEGTLTWRDVRVLPNARESYPSGGGDNHYFVARETDATPVEVASQREKFLFYRGVGGFTPRLRATVADDGRISIGSADGKGVGSVTVFENAGGQIAYTTHHLKDREATVPRPTRRSGVKALHEELVQRLVAQGLYRREAVAMVNTWRDSWFEEGTRLFYIVSRADVDALLPLEIVPAPAAVERVFVGRMELITPAIQEKVRIAIEKRDGATLMRHGRFLTPIVERLAEAHALHDPLFTSNAMTLAWSSHRAPAVTCQ